MQNKKILYSIIPTLVIFILLGSLFGGYYYKLYNGRNKPIMMIGDNNITQAEFDYYYNSYYKMYLSNFSAFFDYMGVDSNADLEMQEYENGKTFKELFDECTVDQIKKIYALHEEGLDVGFEYDSEKSYEEYIKMVNDSLNNSSKTLDEYFKTYYGTYATEELIKKYIIMGYYANAYYEYLIDNSSEDDAYKHTEELKNKLTVNYL